MNDTKATWVVTCPTSERLGSIVAQAGCATTWADEKTRKEVGFKPALDRFNFELASTTNTTTAMD